MGQNSGLIRSAAKVMSLAIPVALAGCGGSAPSVSSSTTPAQVRGIVKYKGKAVTEGEIVFDPTNIHRKSAQFVTVPIGKDGSYSATTLVGDNAISFKLPRLSKQDNSLAYVSIPFQASSGENTLDIELPLPKP